MSQATKWLLWLAAAAFVWCILMIVVADERARRSVEALPLALLVSYGGYALFTVGCVARREFWGR
jgi:predicted membrane-bound dolichyl-phosphate-mannose-protein mannosyltransferase